MKFKFPVRKKTEVKTYNQTVVNTVILVVVLVLFLYVAIQLSRNFSAQVSTQRTQIVTDVTYSHLDGVIFKNSDVISSDADIVHYLVSDGEKVSVGMAFAEVYSNTGMSKASARETEDTLNSLSDRIALLQHSLDGTKNVSDLGMISDEISSAYYAYINAILSGDLMNAERTGEELFSSLADYSSITLSEATQNTLSELISQRDSLLSSIGGSKKTLFADESFTFSRTADGYEGILDSSKLDALTRAELDSLSEAAPHSTGSALGSLTYSSKWQLVLPVGEAGYELFRGNIGSTYSVEFLGSNGLTVKMLLETAVRGEDDPDSSYLVFSSHDLAKIEGFDRHQSVRISLNSITGYRIPEEALRYVDRQNGVYILVGKMIEFRRVTVIGKGNGYYIVNTYENDNSEGSLSDIPYLYINDLIVISGNDLYDGKLLD